MWTWSGSPSSGWISLQPLGSTNCHRVHFLMDGIQLDFSMGPMAAKRHTSSGVTWRSNIRPRFVVYHWFSALHVRGLVPWIHVSWSEPRVFHSNPNLAVQIIKSPLCCSNPYMVDHLSQCRNHPTSVGKKLGMWWADPPIPHQWRGAGPPKSRHTAKTTYGICDLQKKTKKKMRWNRWNRWNHLVSRKKDKKKLNN